MHCVAALAWEHPVVLQGWFEPREVSRNLFSSGVCPEGRRWQSLGSPLTPDTDSERGAGGSQRHQAASLGFPNCTIHRKALFGDHRLPFL